MRTPTVKVPHQKGQSMLELAVGVTVLLILVAGLIDVGRAIFYYLSMRDAAQEGLVYASIYPTFCNQVGDMVRSSMNDPSVDVTVMVDHLSCNGAGPSHACANKPVEVIVSQDNFPITMPFIGGFLGTQNLRFEAKVNGTILRPKCN